MQTHNNLQEHTCPVTAGDTESGKYYRRIIMQ